MTGPRPYSPDNPFAPGPTVQTPARRYSADNPFAPSSGASDEFADVSGGSSTVTASPPTKQPSPLTRGIEAIPLGIGAAFQGLRQATGVESSDIVREGVQGFTGGFGDEIGLTDKAKVDQFRQEHPFYALGANAAGMAANPLSRIAPSSLPGQIATGVIGGGVVGAGEAEDGQRGKGAATGAVLGGVVAGTVGLGAKALKSIFSPKTAQQEAGAILDDIASRAGVERAPAEQVAQQMATTRRAATGPLYDAARGETIAVTQDMADALHDPLFYQAHERARLAAQRAGREFVPLYDADGKVLDETAVGTIQAMKRRIKDILKEGALGMATPEAAGQTRKFSDEEAAAIGAARDRVVGAARRQSPTFDAAEQTYAKLSEPISALRRGELFLNATKYKDAAAVAADISRLTPEAQDAFRQGALTALERQASRQNESITGYRRLLKNTNLQERVAAILPVDQQAAFRNAVERNGLADAIRRLVNAPGAVNNVLKPIATVGRGARILGKQAGLGAAGKTVESVAGLSGAELARYLAEAMQR